MGKNLLLAALMLTGSITASGQASSPPRVVMLSDLHFDPFHEPEKVARLVAAPVERWQAILDEGGQAPASRSYLALQAQCQARASDTDETLLDASLRAASAQGGGARWVTVSGDLLAHQFDCRYRQSMGGRMDGYAAFAAKTSSYVMRRVGQAFPSIPVYAALGNNDSGCGDYKLDTHDAYLRGTQAALIAGLRGISLLDRVTVAKSYSAGGNYSVRLGDPAWRMRLIVIDNVYDSTSYQTCGAQASRAGEEAGLSWLRAQLVTAREKGERVWLMGHIPPSVDVYSTFKKLGDVCADAPVKTFLADDELATLVESYSDVIRLAIFAHTHMDEMRLLRGAQGSVPVKLVASISPVDGNHPSFTVGVVDPVKAELKDYTVYVASDENDTPARWSAAYRFGETYGLPSFSGMALEGLVWELKNDRRGVSPKSASYIRNFFPGGGWPVLKLVWPEYTCALDRTTAASFKGCVCGGQPAAPAKPATVR